METLKMYRIHPSVQMPKHQTKGSACFDLQFQGSGRTKIDGYSSKNKPVSRLFTNALTISPGDRMMVPTGLVFDIPEGYSVRLHARSGTSLKQGLVLANSEGVIDSDYVNEVMVLIHNISENAITINEGDRIAQAELVKNEEYSIEETAIRPIFKTTRTGGMGSTGVSEKAGAVIINIPEKIVLPDIVKEKPVEKRGRGRPRKNA